MRFLRDRAPPGAVKEGFSHGGVGSNYATRRNIQRLGYSHVNPPPRAHFTVKYSRGALHV